MRNGVYRGLANTRQAQPQLRTTENGWGFFQRRAADKHRRHSLSLGAHSQAWNAQPDHRAALAGVQSMSSSEEQTAAVTPNLQRTLGARSSAAACAAIAQRRKHSGGSSTAKTHSHHVGLQGCGATS